MHSHRSSPMTPVISARRAHGSGQRSAQNARRRLAPISAIAVTITSTQPLIFGFERCGALPDSGTACFGASPFIFRLRLPLDDDDGCHHAAIGRYRALV